MLLRRWHYLILVFALAWAGWFGYQWHVIGSGLSRMSSVSDSATVVRNEKRQETSSTGKKGYRKVTSYFRPVIEFEDSDHVLHTAPSIHETTNKGSHPKGEEVSVLYDPMDPESGCIIVGDEEQTAGEARGKLITAISLVVIGFALFAVAEVGNRMWDRANAMAGEKAEPEPTGEGPTEAATEDSDTQDAGDDSMDVPAGESLTEPVDDVGDAPVDGE